MWRHSPQTCPALASSTQSRELTLTLVNIHQNSGTLVSATILSHFMPPRVCHKKMLQLVSQQRRHRPGIDNMRQNPRDNKRPEILSRLNSVLICDCKYLVVTDEAILVPTSFVISRQGQSFAYNNFSFIPPKNNFPPRLNFSIYRSYQRSARAKLFLMG